MAGVIPSVGLSLVRLDYGRVVHLATLTVPKLFMLMGLQLMKSQRNCSVTLSWARPGKSGSVTRP